MGEEDSIRKKKGSSGKMKLKPVEMKVAGGDSDDDDEPIGSLFKFKKPRTGKRSKSGLVGVKVEAAGVEKSRVGDVDLGGMNDTLASFRKKLKGPRIVGESGSGLLDRSSVRASMDGAAVGLDSPSAEYLECVPGAKGKRRQRQKRTGKEPESHGRLDLLISMQEQEERILNVGGSLGDSSDENMKDLLSGFVRKAQSGSVRKARSSSRRRAGNGSGKTSAGVSKEPPVTIMPKSEGGFVPGSDGTSKDPVLVKGRGVRRASRFDGNLDRTSGESSEDEPLSVVVGKVSSASDRKGTAEARRSDEGLRQTSSLIGRDGLSVSVPHTMEETAGCNDGQFDISSKRIPEDPSSAVHRRSNSGSIPCPREKSETPDNDSLDGLIEGAPEGRVPCDDGLDQPCVEAMEDRPSGQVPETCSVSSEIPKEEYVRSDDGLNQSSEIIPAVLLRNAAQNSCPMRTREATSSCFDYDLLNGAHEETQKVNHPGCDDCLDKISKITKKEFPDHVPKFASVSNLIQAEETTGCDELKLPAFENMQDGLSCLDGKSSMTSMPMQMDQTLPSDDGLNKCSNRLLKDFQSQRKTSSSGSIKIEATPCCDDDLNQPPDESIGNPIFVAIQKPHLASVATEIEVISRADGGLDRLYDGMLSVLPSEALEKPDLASSLNHKEELTDTGDVLNQFSDGLAIDSTSFIKKSCSDSPQTQPSDDASERQFDDVPVRDSFSVKEGKSAGGQSIMPDLKETYPDDAGRASDPDKLDKKLSEMQRAVRKVKKRRHGDMAYEGDIDWEILMHEQGPFENNPFIDGDRPMKTKDKPDTRSNMLAEANNGGAAAVAAGLKARAVGPVEKVKFKEVLKRRGGLQEYIECRNFILDLWSKDMCHILPLVDCGVTDAPSEDEPPRASLIREIYSFLDYSGYINVGIASEKEKAKSHSIPHLKLSKGNKPNETSGGQNADSQEEVGYILGQVKISEYLIAVKNNVSVADGRLASALDVEATKSDYLVPSKGPETASCKLHAGMQTACVACAPVPVSSEKIEVSETCSDGKVLPKTGSCMPLMTDREDDCMDAQVTNTAAELDASSTDPSCKTVDGGLDSASALDQIKSSCSKHQPTDINRENVAHVGSIRIECAGRDPMEVNDILQCDQEVCKRVIIIGAGPAGLTAARHLQRQGFSVNVLEARNRIGGRVYTDRSSLSVPVDLGASIITGVEADVATERRPDPSSLICGQLGLELTVLNSDCPLYDIVTGQKVPADLDEALEAEYNSLLDDMVVLVAQNGEGAMKMSLEEGLEYALKRRRVVQSTAVAKESDQFKIPYDSEVLDTSANGSVDTAIENNADNRLLDNSILYEELLSPLERRVMDWHFANLEYGCAALLKAVSLPYWNQDDVYGGFGGAHCMIKGGYSAVLESLCKGLSIHLNHVVTEVMYNTRDSGGTSGRCSEVKVSTSSGDEFVGDAVLITVPLGCLKANMIKFSPVLPDWKQSSIQRLGFGVLNKVVLEFPEVFWDDTVDYFGATAEETDCRGQCFMFWNIKKTVGAPVLIALVVGKAAIDGQSMSSLDHVNHALMVLRKLFGEASVPNPIASVVTNWGKDPFSRGAYSYVAVGASGEDYDILARPVENCLFFAGEATCKEHPDTVGGAMMSGLREAVRIIDIFNTGNDCTSEVEAMEAAQRQSDSERNEVRDMVKRLDAVELSNVLCKGSWDGTQRFLTKDALLRDMFSNTKTTSGRLHLAKELLRLPVEVLKSFAGTKEGLSTLNSWILDSMGKDGTQLLRHCVRLLVRVSTDLLAVRSSGIGRTIKEKVCVHTSRDIRAVASQLVSMWIEVFRKEKAANGGLKLLRQTVASDSSKIKSKDIGSGKPPLRMSNEVSDSRGNLQVPSSAGSDSPSNPNNKKVDGRPAKLETMNDTKAKINPRPSHAIQNRDSKLDESNVLSEAEAAAFAAAEAARAAALAAAEAYASSEAECSTLRELPKIPSFHKFARREQYAQVDDFDVRRKWLGGMLGRQDCISEIDSRNCRVRNWSVDFSATCGNIDSSRTSGDNYTQRSNSNDLGGHLNVREHSGESVAVDCRLTKAWVDSAGSGGVKDYRAIEMWQSQAVDAYSDYFNPSVHVRDEEDSNKMSKLSIGKTEREGEESSGSLAAENKGSVGNQPRGAEHIKQAVVDYVASLLMPLYKARKIDKEGYKSIMKKSVTKVMDHSTEAEKGMTVYEFLDFKRKNKIRSFVDKLIERHMAMNPNTKP
ncbi:lysine-specific histone demethylase 1 homolog 3 [Magnolia sinica]|uniref:lysine-specific histone demethylase 1 homolog 3 n=1 Tax=Magnolia sinica TaxID=86752 RepID=UPI002658E1FE|nr:lysine-specific histone demethylase 1 homolog 3 [Magnolia sinica]